MVLASGGAALFLAVDIPGTFVTVLAKGILCGFISGLAYNFLKKWNSTIAAIIAAILCPIVNTGVFMLGCFIFFMDDVVTLASNLGSAKTGAALFVSLALGNFLFELVLNAILSPVFVKLLNIRKKV